MELHYAKGDLFQVRSNFVLAHCIAQDARLGAGIALQFRQRYPSMIKYIINNNPKYPSIIKYKGNDNRIIYNIIDKPFSNRKPQRENLTSALYQLKDILVKDNIKYLAIPKIGAGLDGLDWNITEQSLKQIFDKTNIIIYVCVL